MSCDQDLIIRGEDKTLLASVSMGSDRDLSTAIEILAVIKDRSRTDTTENGPQITCTDTGEADWRSGKVAIPYTADQTQALSVGSGWELELRITMADGKIRKGFSAQGIMIADSKLDEN